MGGSHYRVERWKEWQRQEEEAKVRGIQRANKSGGREVQPFGRGREGRSMMPFYFFQKLIEIARDHLPIDLLREAGLIRSIRRNDREMSSGLLSSPDGGGTPLFLMARSTAGSPWPQIESRNRFQAAVHRPSRSCARALKYICAVIHLDIGGGAPINSPYQAALYAERK